uniref:Conserved secreted protein n=1 Tax=Macrostomum lignano TaxID=282301 RepID=A0A1I8G2A3_9PLAT
ANRQAASSRSAAISGDAAGARAVLAPSIRQQPFTPTPRQTQDPLGTRQLQNLSSSETKATHFDIMSAPLRSAMLLLAATLCLLSGTWTGVSAHETAVQRICGRNPFSQMKQMAEQILGRYLDAYEFNAIFNRALNDKFRGRRLRQLVTQYQDCRLAVENGHF